MTDNTRVPLAAQGAGPRTVYQDIPDNELWKIRVQMQLNPQLYSPEDVADVEGRWAEFEKTQRRNCS